MTEELLLQHDPSGERYVGVFDEEGQIVALSVALAETDVAFWRDGGDVEVSAEDVAWARQQRFLVRGREA